MHRILVSTTIATPGVVEIGGDEAHHAARVKRLEVGDGVELLDGRGRLATGTLHAISKTRAGDWVVSVQVADVRVVAKTRPAVDVVSGVPKGDRLAEMIDGLSQVGAASWRPLVSERAIVEPREGKLSRLERVCAEACKQCGRAWAMTIGEALPLTGALRATGGPVVVADASGAPLGEAGIAADSVRLVIGPEGGFSEAELALARATTGVSVIRFGVHAMRVETAACVAAGMIVEWLRR